MGSVGKIVLLEPPQEGETRALVLQDSSVEEGYLSPLREGEPINGREMIQLGPCAGSPQVWDILERTSFSEDRSGPAKVTSPAYRDNYDSIFSKDLPN